MYVINKQEVLSVFDDKFYYHQVQIVNHILQSSNDNHNM